MAVMLDEKRARDGTPRLRQTGTSRAGQRRHKPALVPLGRRDGNPTIPPPLVRLQSGRVNDPASGLQPKEAKGRSCDGACSSRLTSEQLPGSRCGVQVSMRPNYAAAVSTRVRATMAA